MKSQEWKIVRTKTDDPLNKPVKTMIVFNDQPVGLVQSYSIGQSLGNQHETLLLEIACPKLSIEEITEEELNERLGNVSKYSGGEEVLPSEEDSELLEVAAGLANAVAK